MANTFYDNLVLGDGPWGYFPLNETSGTTATDLAAGHNGNYLGTAGTDYTLGVTPGPIKGDSTGAINLLNTTASHGVSLQNPAIANGSPWSVEGWAYFGTAPGTGAFYTLFGMNGTQRWLVGSSRTMLYQANGSYTGTLALNIAAWNHVALVYDPTMGTYGSFVYYVNGNPDTAYALPSASASGYNSTAYFGQYDTSVNYKFIGKLGHFGIYAKRLTTAQIRNHYNAGLNGQPLLSPASLTFTDPLAKPQTLTITQGTAPFSVASSNQNAATASVSGTTVTVTPVAAGSANITVNDAATVASAASTATVNPVMTASSTNVTFTNPTSAAQAVTISGGAAPYSVYSKNTSIVNATNSGGTITLTPAGTGGANVVVTDADGEQLTINVTVGANVPGNVGSTFKSAPSFTTRVPLQFLCPDNTSLNITGASALINNPAQWTINAGAVGKTDPGLNGTAYYRGNGELPPFSIDMTWKSLGLNDYMKLAAIVPYYIHLISFRNLGYWGRLQLAGPDSQQTNSADIFQVKAKFFPLSPSDYGGAQALNRITPPASVNVTTRGANTGYLPSGTPLYYWLTFSGDYGETTPSPVSTITPGANDSAQITWTWPTSTAYCTKASIYVATVNDPTQAKFVDDVPNGLPASWIDYVGPAGSTVSQAPPTSNTAYRGSWLGGVWFNETP